jgi:hypothetical protein
MISSFLIGPQFTPGSKDQDFIDVYAPYVYLKTKDGQLTKFQMFVYLGYKTMFVMFLKPETDLKTQTLK